MMKKIKITILYVWQIPENVIIFTYMIYLIFKLLLNSDLTSIYLTNSEDIAKLITDKLLIFYEKYFYYIQCFNFLFWVLQINAFYQFYMTYTSN